MNSKKNRRQLTDGALELEKATMALSAGLKMVNKKRCTLADDLKIGVTTLRNYFNNHSGSGRLIHPILFVILDKIDPAPFLQFLAQRYGFILIPNKTKLLKINSNSMVKLGKEVGDVFEKYQLITTDKKISKKECVAFKKETHDAVMALFTAEEEVDKIHLMQNE